MKKQFDVIALGELLIDFTVNGKSERGNNVFEANPGGAPCNVLAILEKLGKKTAFIGKVGNDQFGHLLRETIEEVGINAENLIMDRETNTTLAFVHTFSDGDREFSFYRKPGADMMLCEGEISEEVIKQAKIFHFGTLSMTHKGVKAATMKAVDLAKRNCLLISLDPNLRLPLWSSEEEAREQILTAMEYCDILKISNNEIQFVTGVEDYDEGIQIIRDRFQIPLVCLTLGKDGSRAYYKNIRVEVPGFCQENVVDTTGAGDTFCGCVLNYVLEKGIEDLTEENLKEMLIFSNAGASLVTTKKGAIRSMPEKTEIDSMIK